MTAPGPLARAPHVPQVSGSALRGQTVADLRFALGLRVSTSATARYRMTEHRFRRWRRKLGIAALMALTIAVVGWRAAIYFIERGPSVPSAGVPTCAGRLHPRVHPAKCRHGRSQRLGFSHSHAPGGLRTIGYEPDGSGTKRDTSYRSRSLLRQRNPLFPGRTSAPLAGDRLQQQVGRRRYPFNGGGK